MSFTHTGALLQEIEDMKIPLSETVRGTAIHQTCRNQLARKFKEAMLADWKEYIDKSGSNVLAFLTKEGIVLDIPNTSIIETADPNTCNGSISVVLATSIKGLEYDAAIEAEDYLFELERRKERDVKKEQEKQAKIARDKKAREQREAKKAAMVARAKYSPEDED